MAFLIQRLAAGLVSRADEAAARQASFEPERVVLPARAGAAPSPKPPVRIFLGTEPAQYRAERVFVWSIECVRDPTRVYEIYLMKNLPGFDRRWWLTGFTNYRFAIPELAGGHGRAIYNDVDQVYLADPAELFDAEMGGHGFLSISDRDTSVMLMDCARMGAVWTLHAARQERRRTLEGRARAVPGLWGAMAPGWNARDEEYAPGRSHLVHFTTIHAQPWRPFPQHYVYRENPVAEVWWDLERSAADAAYHLFDSTRPSRAYAAWRALPDEACPEPTLPDREREDIRLALARVEARTAVCYPRALAPGADVTITVADAGSPPWEHSAGQQFDAVVCWSGLESLPGEDLAWVVEGLFARARRLVSIAVDETRSTPSSGGRYVSAPALLATRWYDCVEAASRRHPHVYWRLALRRRRRGPAEVHIGGHLPGGTPHVWVLAHHKAGHTTQSLGLIEALGWPHELKELPFSAAGYVGRRLAEALGPARVLKDAWGPLAPPWPDVVCATGWLPARAARWLARRSGGRTRAVLLGRKSGPVPERFDVVLSCAHFRLPRHPRRVETLLPPTRVTLQRLSEEAAGRGDPFQGMARPHIVILVGGSSRSHRLDAATARRLGRDVAALATTSGGAALALTSRRTGRRATAALEMGLGSAGRVRAWRPKDPDNPYLAALARADVVVVTGESESMLAEAAVAGKPLYIYPVPVRSTPWLWLSRWVATRARAEPRNRRGTVRPQQGLEYLCARLVERALVLPPRDLEGLHQSLIDRGIARRFGTPLSLEPCRPFAPAAEAAVQVRARLGFTEGQQHGPGMQRKSAREG
jgi:mitochondrial fission protein ELM1